MGGKNASAIGDNFEFQAEYEYIFTIETEEMVIYAPEHDAKLTEIILLDASPYLTTQEEVKVRILNNGKQNFSSVQLSYTVDSGAAVTETFAVTLVPYEDTLYTFSTKADFSRFDKHSVVAEVIYDMDMNSMNNSIEGFIEASAPDILFTRVLAPISSCEIASDAKLGAKIANQGMTAVSEFTLTYQIGSEAPVSQTFTETVAPHDTITVYFDQSPDFSTIGSYEIKYTASTPNELITNNNTAQTVVKHFEPLTEMPHIWFFENEEDRADWVNGEGEPNVLGKGWSFDQYHPLGQAIYANATTIPLLS